ncbi:hypothetical protein AB1N83_010547, partial [Pleurotus pulmonarius]
STSTQLSTATASPGPSATQSSAAATTPTTRQCVHRKSRSCRYSGTSYLRQALVSQWWEARRNMVALSCFSVHACRISKQSFLTRTAQCDGRSLRPSLVSRSLDLRCRMPCQIHLLFHAALPNRSRTRKVNISVHGDHNPSPGSLEVWGGIVASAVRQPLSPMYVAMRFTSYAVDCCYALPVCIFLRVLPGSSRRAHGGQGERACYGLCRRRIDVHSYMSFVQDSSRYFVPNSIRPQMNILAFTVLTLCATYIGEDYVLSTSPRLDKHPTCSRS